MKEAGSRRRGAGNVRFKGEWFTTVQGRPRAFVWIDEEMRLRLGVKNHTAPRARVVWLNAHPGETLTRWQPIHHINGDTLDDRPENLERMPSSKDHMTHHGESPDWGKKTAERAPDHSCAGCEKPIRPWKKWCSAECMNAHRRGNAHQNTGREWPAEMRAQISATLTGRKDSEEVRARKREAHLRRWARIKAERQEAHS